MASLGLTLLRYRKAELGTEVPALEATDQYGAIANGIAHLRRIHASCQLVQNLLGVHLAHVAELISQRLPLCF
jgi:hypothetical protein